MNSKDLSLLLLRVGLGGLFFWAGWVKVTAPTAFTAAGYLNSATGPFAEAFKTLAGNATVDLLVAWGLTLGGLALISGIFTKLASVGLAVLMALIYLSRFPPTSGYIDSHVIYILALVIVFTFDTGSVWGLGKWVKLPSLLK